MPPHTGVPHPKKWSGPLLQFINVNRIKRV